MSYVRVWAEAWYNAHACGLGEAECDRMADEAISRIRQCRRGNDSHGRESHYTPFDNGGGGDNEGIWDKGMVEGHL